MLYFALKPLTGVEPKLRKFTRKDIWFNEVLGTRQDQQDLQMEEQDEIWDNRWKIISSRYELLAIHSRGRGGLVKNWSAEGNHDRTLKEHDKKCDLNRFDSNFFSKQLTVNLIFRPGKNIQREQERFRFAVAGSDHKTKKMKNYSHRNVMESIVTANTVGDCWSIHCILI